MVFRTGSALRILGLIAVLSTVYCSYDNKHPYEASLIDLVPDPRHYPYCGFLEPTCIPSRLYKNFSSGQCDRVCKPGDVRTCHYVLQLVTAVANDPIACSGKYPEDPSRRCIRTDGVETAILAINYQMPGPTIAVCTGDKIIVDIVNQMTNYKLTLSNTALERNMYEDMDVFKVKGGRNEAVSLASDIWRKYFDPAHYAEKYGSQSNYEGVVEASGDIIYRPDPTVAGEGTAIHYHGALQEETAHHDGVPFVTQELIPSGSFYRYCFGFKHRGTFFYHSHYKVQRSEGLFGYFLVRSAYEPHRHLYNYDRTSDHMIVSDNPHNLSHVADNLIFNSFGCFRKPNEKVRGYVSVYKMKPNKKYLFRVVGNIITSMKVNCWIDNHPLLLTAVDGNSIKPVSNVTVFSLANGERVDFVITTNQPIGNYEIHCVSSRNQSLHQVGIIHYVGAPPPPGCDKVNLTKAMPEGLQLNPENSVPGTAGAITISELKGIEKIHEYCKKEEVPIYHVDMGITSRGLQINNITDEFPPVAMLKEVSYYGGYNTSNVCNAQSAMYQEKKCSENACSCLHVVKFQKCICAAILLTGPHPFHPHGIRVYVIGSGLIPANRTMSLPLLAELHSKGLVKWNLKNPPLKDTVIVPRNGFVVVRFMTSNPGVWIAHCHIELHGMTGMSMVLQFGEPKDMIRKAFKHHFFEPRKNNLCK